MWCSCVFQKWRYLGWDLLFLPGWRGPRDPIPPQAGATTAEVQKPGRSKRWGTSKKMTARAATKDLSPRANQVRQPAQCSILQHQLGVLHSKLQLQGHGVLDAYFMYIEAGPQCAAQVQQDVNMGKSSITSSAATDLRQLWESKVWHAGKACQVLW